MRGAIAKQNVIKTILSTFGDAAFLSEDGKELRVEQMEDGELVQIKVALTCAKVNIERPAGDGSSKPIPTSTTTAKKTVEPSNPETNAGPPSTEEQQKIADLLSKLNL